MSLHSLSRFINNSEKYRDFRSQILFGIKKATNLKVRLINSFIILIGSIILMYDAFNNNYPLVYPDSGTYIKSGFEMWIPIDRPIFYGIFIRHLSLATSLWYVVFAQSLILTYLLYLVFREIFNNSHFKIYFISTIFILSITTGISFNVSMLTADIFTSFMFLSVYLLLFGTNRNKKERIIVHLIFMFSLITHNSHISILFITLFCISILYALRNMLSLRFPFSFNKILYTWCIYFATILMIPCINYFIGKKFIISESSHIFIMHKLNDEEVLEPYLDENCERKHYTICTYKDNLPWDLLWDPKSPITKDGDWNKFKVEDNKIILDILTTYKYVKKLFLKRIQQTFRQFFNFDTGDAPADDMINPPLHAINQYFNDEKKEFLSSQQVTKKLNFNTINYIQSFFVFLSVFVFILIFLLHHAWMSIKIKFGILVLMIFEFSNSLVCSTLSIVLDRFQSRVIWLIPIFAIIILFNYFEVYRIKLNIGAIRKK